MVDKKSLEHDGFAAAELSSDQLDSILTLEQNLRSDSNKDIVLIAYEDREHITKE